MSIKLFGSVCLGLAILLPLSATKQQPSSRTVAVESSQQGAKCCGCNKAHGSPDLLEKRQPVSTARLIALKTLSQKDRLATKTVAMLSDCCSANLACCTPQSACCSAEAKLGCCQSGKSCCSDKKPCCTGDQTCCAAGAKCCAAAKPCCGSAGKSAG